MIAQTFVAIAETFIFGRLGTPALAGFALVFPFMMMMTMMAAGGMGGGVAAAMARAMGGGRRDDARALVLHALVLGAGLALRLHPARLDGVARALPPAGRRGPGARQRAHLQPRAVQRLARHLGQLLPVVAAARRRRCRDAGPLTCSCPRSSRCRCPTCWRWASATGRASAWRDRRCRRSRPRRSPRSCRRALCGGASSASFRRSAAFPCSFACSGTSCGSG